MYYYYHYHYYYLMIIINIILIHIVLISSLSLSSLSSSSSLVMLKKSFICMRTKVNPSIISPYKIASEINIHNNINMPAIILVEPHSDANIGSCSRAMLNFCLTDLRLVNPKANHLSDTARTLAVGSFEILENAKIHSNIIVSQQQNINSLY